LTRPLLVIFLTIFVNLVGFGIIVPLLPFYAERFGASGFTIGVLFGIFSLCQLVASPILGAASDRFGRRPVLIFSLAGTVASFVMMAMAQSIEMLFLARIVDGLSGGNISTARAYVADVTKPEERSRAYGIIGAAFGLGFILGPALSGVLAPVSYTAPMWAAAGITAVALLMAVFWLPETLHLAKKGAAPAQRAGLPLRSLRSLLRRPQVRHILAIDFAYWLAFAVFQTTFALFVSHRFGFDAGQTGYVFAAFGVLGAIVQGAFIRPIVARLGDKPTFLLGIVCSVGGLVAATFTPSVWMFMIALIPLALGIGFGHPTVSSMVSRSAHADEQGRVQGAASAVESLGRAIGPVWGNTSLQRFGDSMPYLSAAGLLVMTLVLTWSYPVSDADRVA
jgi:DHA1 family tetracycline resistance protein-like MFS transporter